MRRLFFIFIILVTAFTACDSNEPQVVKDYPLKYFKLQVGDRFYHAEIDQDSKQVRIGAIQFGGEVLGVDYLLAKGYTIDPDPQTLLGKWPEEQVFGIAKEGEELVQYTVSLSAYKSKWPEASGEIIFFDDFDQIDGLDLSVWKYIPASNAAWAVNMSGKPEQSFVKDGYLNLYVEKKNGKYQAAGVKTEGNKWFSNCHIEVRALLSDSEAIGQAIWLMPQSPFLTYIGWPECGEIDVMEKTWYDNKQYRATLHSSYIHNIQPGVASGWCNWIGPTKGFVDGGWNVYGVDMTDEYINFYINGNQVAHYENRHLDDELTSMQWPFSSPFYLIFSASEARDDGTLDEQLPATFLVDWVKVTRI